MKLEFYFIFSKIICLVDQRNINENLTNGISFTMNGQTND